MDNTLFTFVGAGLAAYAALKGELAYRGWKARKALPGSVAVGWHPPVPIKLLHEIRGSAEKIFCTTCGVGTYNHKAYSDGAVLCLLCAAKKEN